MRTTPMREPEPEPSREHEPSSLPLNRSKRSLVNTAGTPSPQSWTIKRK